MAVLQIILCNQHGTEPTSSANSGYSRISLNRKVTVMEREEIERVERELDAILKLAAGTDHTG